MIFFDSYKQQIKKRFEITKFEQGELMKKIFIILLVMAASASSFAKECNDEKIKCVIGDIACDWAGYGTHYNPLPRCTAVYADGQEVGRKYRVEDAVRVLKELRSSGYCE